MWPLEEEENGDEDEDEVAAPCWAQRRWPQAGCSVLTLLFPCPFSALKKKKNSENHPRRNTECQCFFKPATRS